MTDTAMAKAEPIANGHAYPIEFKSAVIESVPERISQGHTLEQIAQSHGITARCIKYWIASNEDCIQARNAYIDNKLLEAEEAIEQATEPFPLARAREMLRSAQWTAERRDNKRYGAKQELAVTTVHTESLPGRAGELLELIEAGLRERNAVVIEHD